MHKPVGTGLPGVPLPQQPPCRDVEGRDGKVRGELVCGWTRPGPAGGRRLHANGLGQALLAAGAGVACSMAASRGSSVLPSRQGRGGRVSEGGWCLVEVP
eukprot:364999-Chlamydomonas_euryale.AAC.33